MADTAFQSDESSTRDEFWQWVNERPRSDINHYELLTGRIVTTPPAGASRVRSALALDLNDAFQL